MFIAHLPAGYIATKVFTDKYAVNSSRHVHLIWFFGLLSSIAPDLDLLYFYGVDSSVHHHKLFPHIPLFWFICFSLLFLCSYIIKNTTFKYITILAAFNVLVHLILDTVVGFVWWLYPLVDKPYYFFSVPSVHSHWVLNFVLHWTFIFEVCILMIAAYLLLRKKA